MKKNCLYISYDGMLEGLGYSQVVSYLIKLSNEFNIFLLSFEKKSDLKCADEVSMLENLLKESGVVWIRLKYHKSPPVVSTLYDLMCGILVGIYLVRKLDIKLIHSRSYVPALIGYFLKRLFNVRLIFDMRGFWPDERVDANQMSKNSIVYKIAKYCEKMFICNSDAIVSLTKVAAIDMRNRYFTNDTNRRIYVIPTCVDLDRFNISEHKSKNLVIGYVGTVTGWYEFEHTVRCFRILLNKLDDAKILIVNKGEHDYIRKMLGIYSVPDSRVEIITASQREIHKYISKMNVSVFFIKKTYSKTASSPTKLGELLASGVCCLTNDGIGDVSEILNENDVGEIVYEYTDPHLECAIDNLLSKFNNPSIQERCRSCAIKYYSLESGVAKYTEIYNSLL